MTNETAAAQSSSLDDNVRRLGFASTLVLIATGVLAMVLPLDVPDGFNATHAERVAWFAENRGAFIMGWINQILAMLSLSGLLFAIAWQIRATHPLLAMLAGTSVALSVVVFLIPKFIAVWSIPLLSDAAAMDPAADTLANTLLVLLNVSVPYSLFTSFDYLGFWLYAVFALLVAAPLYGASAGAKVIAISMGAYGLIYHGLIGAMLAGSISPAEIESWFVGIFTLQLIVLLVIGLGLRRAAHGPHPTWT